MVNWKSFEAKYNKVESWAFEQMSYFLFCVEMDVHTGVFRYKDQTGIETEPIENNGMLCGFQSKYYTTPISQNKSDIIASIHKAKEKNPQIKKILLYINQDISESSKRNEKKPKYQLDIENHSEKLGLIIDWRVKSHFEYQLSLSKNKWLFDIFFGNNGLDPEFFEKQVEKEIKNLGPRFNEKLNFELPIAKVFDYLSNSRAYHQTILEKTDKWLTERRYRKLVDSDLIVDIESELETLQHEIEDWLIDFNNYSFESEITILPLKEKLEVFNKKISEKWNELIDLSIKDREKEDKSKKTLEFELSRLRQIQNDNREFIDNIDSLNINLANHPTLIIKGEAGSGKSHLLGDISTQRKNQKLPTILLLGITFTHTTTIERNILEKLDLRCSFNYFMEILNGIGLQINSRVLVLVDAINEGAGVDLWKNQIAGFVDEVSKYPAVGLVLTIRSTYFNDIIPVDFKSNSNINIITHEGFKGNEYAALKLFCEHYDLRLPNFPILNPEFTNPLFLHTICEAVKDLPDKSFPKGFNGINKTYSLYKKSLNKKFGEKRPEYKYQDIVSKAIEKLATSIFDTDYHRLYLSDGVELFNTEFSNFPLLLSDLIEESILIVIRNEYDREDTRDIVLFSYQRLGDFFMAEELLKPYLTKEEIENAFIQDKKFQKITNEYQWSCRGIIEAFSILLPERYNFELFELSEFFLSKNVNKSNKKWSIIHTYESFTQILLDSLKWRNPGSIDEIKINKWLEKTNRLRYDDWLYTLTELAAIPNHPYNSDRLCKMLMKYSMPERDVFLQKYFRSFSGYDDNNIAFPLQRLIDWAWLPNVSYNCDNETIRLVAQTLVWVMSSTDIALRDRTTKVLVNLLEQKSEVLIQTLTVFQNIDDIYILERLFAVAYGCILRTESDDSIKAIGQFIYDVTFKNGNPPVHILIRDYARNSVEYAIFKDVGLEIDVNLIRPPYNSEMPQIPTQEDVKMYELDYNAPDYKQIYGPQQNHIIYSTTSDINDFHKHEIKAKLNHFCSISFKVEQHYKLFLKSLNSNQRSTIKLLEKLFECKEIINERKNDYFYMTLKKNVIQLDHLSEEVDNDIHKCKSRFNKLFTANEQKYLDDEIIPFIQEKSKPQRRQHFDTKPIERWIIQKVFDLGYNKKNHGEYDDMAERWYGYGSEHKIRRIGEKYQWIAWYEILARITDNYKMEHDWNGKYSFYKGAWQNYIRDIDPAYITRNKDENNGNSSKFWWSDTDYNHWNYPDSEWVNSIDDLIDPKIVIEKKALNGEMWLHLQHFVEWDEPKKIGIGRYEGRRKQIFYLIQGLLVKHSEKNKIINYLKNHNFWGRWLPENSDDHTEIINREKFWSPAYLDIYKDNKKIWETIQDTKYKVIVATESANGCIENDKSDANRSYNIPCKYIFEGMSLQYAPVDGNLKNVNREVIVMNSNPRGVLMRKKDLIEFLEKNDMDIIWTLLGEKFSFDNNRDEESFFKVPCGVYYLESGQISGEIRMYDRE